MSFKSLTALFSTKNLRITGESILTDSLILLELTDYSIAASWCFFFKCQVPGHFTFRKDKLCRKTCTGTLTFLQQWLSVGMFRFVLGNLHYFPRCLHGVCEVRSLWYILQFKTVIFKQQTSEGLSQWSNIETVFGWSRCSARLNFGPATLPCLH